MTQRPFNPSAGSGPGQPPAGSGPGQPASGPTHRNERENPFPPPPPPSRGLAGFRPEPHQAPPHTRLRCQATVGFFVLGRCPQPAVVSCSRCGRPLCDRHVLSSPAGPLCAECLEEHNPGTGLWVHDPTWAARYRRRYRRDAGQRLGDSGIWWSFDSYDQYYFDRTPGDCSVDDDWNHDPCIYDS